MVTSRRFRRGMLARPDPRGGVGEKVFVRSGRRDTGGGKVGDDMRRWSVGTVFIVGIETQQWIC